MTHAWMRRVIWVIALCAMIFAALVANSNAKAAGEMRMDPTIVPTVNPTLLPRSAIQASIKITADSTRVWRPEVDQKMFLDGNVTIEVGYRVMRAPQAIVWLTPSAESGSSVFDVAIYLSGAQGKEEVSVDESPNVGKTTSRSDELLVTTRVAQSAILSGPAPVPMKKDEYTKFEKENKAYARGESLRLDLLNKPPPTWYIPQITFTPAEQALQRGWIAKGPGNTLIAGPAETSIALGGAGSGASTQARREGVGPETPPVEKPRPQVIVAFFKASSFPINDGKEQVTVVNNPFLMMDKKDDRPALQLRAENGVFFSPPDVAQKAATAQTQPAGGTGGTEKKGPVDITADASKFVTGVYLEGDVTIISGTATIHAEKIYYDLTSDRAIILDAHLSAVDDKRNVPVSMRASEIRQVSQTEFMAKNVQFSTSEFYTPHYHIGASSAYLQQVPLGEGAGVEPMQGLGGKTFQYQMDNVTLNMQGTPIFWFPTVAGSTDKAPFPLNKIKVGASKRYGATIETSWDLLSLLGQPTLENARFNLQLDYFGKHGPGFGVDGKYDMDTYNGVLRSYFLYDSGTDKLGRDPARDDLALEQQFRDYINVKHKQKLDENWTVDLELSHISDPNFLENYFQHEFDTLKEQETSIYLKRQGETDALTFYAKFSLYDFTANADLVDDQFASEKLPEFKYFRIGDSITDLFTYYSETSFADVRHNITNYSPSFSGLQNIFAQSYFAAFGPDPARLSNTTIRNFYKSIGWTEDDVLRFDTRHEFDMPLTLGDVKITPYVFGRFTYWDDSFDPTADGGSTERLIGGGGLRISTQFWKIYDDAESTFWDVHKIRHIIEPSLDVYGIASTESRGDLQPYDREVEGISTANGINLMLRQKWQTKRGGPDNYRTTDWITFNVGWTYFANQDDPSNFYRTPPLRGYFFASRPELSLAANSVNVDGSWRVGERVRVLGQANINTDGGRLQQGAIGVAIDQSPYLSYFLGTRYITGLGTYESFGEGGNFRTGERGKNTSNEVTFAIDYQITRKYEIILTESFDTEISTNILTSLTLIRRFPRFNGAITLTYDFNEDDTSVIISMWPEGYQDLGFGNNEVKRTR